MTETTFKDRSQSPINSIGVRNVTPSDDDASPVYLALKVRGAGDLVVKGLDDVTTTLVLAAGDVPYYHPSAVKAVMAATTCTGIIGYV